MTDSRAKGKRREREWAAVLKEAGYQARRTAQNRGEWLVTLRASDLLDLLKADEP